MVFEIIDTTKPKDENLVSEYETLKRDIENDYAVLEIERKAIQAKINQLNDERTNKENVYYDNRRKKFEEHENAVEHNQYLTLKNKYLSLLEETKEKFGERKYICVRDTYYENRPHIAIMLDNGLFITLGSSLTLYIPNDEKYIYSKYLYSYDDKEKTNAILDLMIKTFNNFDLLETQNKTITEYFDEMAKQGYTPVDYKMPITYQTTHRFLFRSNYDYLCVVAKFNISERWNDDDKDEIIFSIQRQDSKHYQRLVSAQKWLGEN
jgi:hypothetical protein